MKKANTRGFRMLPSYYDSMRNLPDEERLKLYDAMMDYGFGNEVEALPALLDGYFQLLCPTIDSSISYYQTKAENAKKGRRKAKNSETDFAISKTETGKVLDSDSELERETESETESEREKESDREGEKGTPVTTLTPPSLKQIRRFCKENHLRLDIDRFHSYYTMKGWRTNNGAVITDWRAAIKNWISREDLYDKQATNRAGPDPGYAPVTVEYD